MGIKEECGVFGIYSAQKTDVASTVYYGLFALQHRGQESCGIVVNDDGVFTSCKDAGLVNEVFNHHDIRDLGEGNIAIGHCRYGKAGENHMLNAQPMVFSHVKGNLALCFNGALINGIETREALELSGSVFHTTSDAEIISNVIIRERLLAPSIEESVSRAMDKLSGAYSIVVMSPRKLIACRDIHGIRPLCFGQLKDSSYIVASESCAITSLGGTLIRDVEPGEIIVFDENGMRTIKDHVGEGKHALCVFEYLYTARPDSIIDGFSVNRARVRAGRLLAIEHPVEADIVIGAPDSGIDAAIGYAHESGIPYEMGFLKNKYIGRTFIAPGQSHREDLVRIKLNVISEVVKDKRVVLVDDSIVRGTTSARTIKILREAGAKEVHMRSSAPPYIDLCYYGTDIGAKEDLIACRHSMKEIAEILDVDSLGFLNVNYLDQLADTTVNGLCKGCFTGEYPTRVPSVIRKSRYDKKISDNAFSRTEK